MASGYTQQEVEKMAEEIESLRNQLSAKEDAASRIRLRATKPLESNTLVSTNIPISKLTQVTTLQIREIHRLRRKLIFGKKSERFISSDPDARQLDIFGEQLSDSEIAQLEKAAKQEEELITNTVSAKKARTPRKDISLENLRVEETIIDPEGINFDEYVCIGSEVTDKLAYKPAEFYIKRTTRRKFALKNQPQELNQQQKERSTVVIAPSSPEPHT